MKKNFTLTEVLVVIAVITILAGIVMPSLFLARSAGHRTKCLSNKSNIVKAMHIYANKNEELIPYKLHGNSYAYIMVGGEDRDYKTRYLSPKELTCTVYPDVYEPGVDGQDAKINNAIGMLNVDDDDWSQNWRNGKSTEEDGSISIYRKFGRFVVKKDTNTIGYSTARMKNPGQLPLFADSYLPLTKADPTPTTVWNFLLAKDVGTSTSTGYVATVHGDQTTVGFADGSARPLGAKALYSECGLLNTLDATLEKKYSF